MRTLEKAQGRLGTEHRHWNMQTLDMEKIQARGRQAVRHAASTDTEKIRPSLAGRPACPLPYNSRRYCSDQSSEED
jgi:hypothetical protein